MRTARLISAPLLLLLLARHDLAWGIGADGPSLLSSSLRMTWGLLVVLAILLIIYSLVKKRMSVLQGGSKGIIKVVEARHLLPKKSLYLVEVRGQEFLLATGSDTIALIARIEAGRPRRSFDDILESTSTDTPQ